LVLGVGCLWFAFWVALSHHPTSSASLLGSMEGCRLVLLFSGGASAFFFLLTTVIHLKH
jgi:hypothetical protein